MIAEMMERRQHERQPVSCPVEITIDGDMTIPGEMCDLSLGGLFVRCDPPPAEGMTCRIEVLLSEAGDRLNVWMEATVARSTDCGAGFQVTTIYQECLDELRDLLLFGATGAAEDLTAPSLWEHVA